MQLLFASVQGVNSLSNLDGGRRRLWKASFSYPQLAQSWLLLVLESRALQKGLRKERVKTNAKEMVKTNAYDRMPGRGSHSKGSRTRNPEGWGEGALATASQSRPSEGSEVGRSYDGKDHP